MKTNSLFRFPPKNLTSLRGRFGPKQTPTLNGEIASSSRYIRIDKPSSQRHIPAFSACKKSVCTVSLLFFVFLLAACSSGNGDPRPPELMLGSDVCEECGMIVSDARYAAATLIENGHTHKFDDLAEMFQFQAKHSEDVVRAWFVHDYESETWIRGETAFYVMSEAIHSPMGYGAVAFETREAADTFAADLVESQVYTFDELNAWMKTRVQ